MKLALLGMGTVGTGVAALLVNQQERLALRAGQALDLKWIVVRDPSKARAISVPQAELTTSLEPVCADGEVEVAVELIGGVDQARDAITKLLRAGKHVVTANKAVLAAHGAELFDVARENGRTICFEASVAGGIPLLTAVGEGLAANEISRVAGILNGTSNYILSQMCDEGRSYEAALAQAQEEGFAEADPTLDVNGADAAQKLAILCRLAFHTHVNASQVPCQGIDTLSKMDIQFAAELGYAVKLLAMAERIGDRLHLRVGPTLVPKDHPMGQVRGEYNAVLIEGDAVGDAFLSGRGAGMMPTASSVVANVIDLATGRAQETFASLRLWETTPPGPSFDSGRLLKSRFYLRFTIDDRPGTLAQIARILGTHQIGISSVIQHETGEEEIGESVPLIIMTHRTSEAAVRTALDETDTLEIVREPTICLHVAD